MIPMLSRISANTNTVQICNHPAQASSLWRRWQRDEERGGGQLLPAAEEMPEVDVKKERDG